MKKSILVLGGSYFIGKRIVEDLVHADFSVTTLNRGTKPCAIAGVERILCDRNDDSALRSSLSGRSFDYVVDVSGLTGMHAAGLARALDWSGVRKLIFISSSAVYAVDQLTAPYSESDQTGPNSYWEDYGLHKIEAERTYMQALSQTGTELVCLRPPYLYGEHNTAQRESFIFHHIVQEKPLLIPNDGHTLLQFLYTGDLAQIIIKLFQKQLPKVSIFNVGNQKPVSIREWISCCEQACGKRAKVIPYDYHADHRKVREFFPFHNYDNWLDVSKIHQLISDETDFIEGLRLSYQWYLDSRDTIPWKQDVIRAEAEILAGLPSCPASK